MMSVTVRVSVWVIVLMTAGVVVVTVRSWPATVRVTVPAGAETVTVLTRVAAGAVCRVCVTTCPAVS